MAEINLQHMTSAEFEAIYNQHWSKLYSVAYNYFRDRTTAQELVQDVFVNLWTKRSQFSEVKNLDAFLFTSIRNKIYDHFDKVAYQERLKLNSIQNVEPERNFTEEYIAYEETFSLVNLEIDKLPATTQTIFRLSRFDRFSNDEIARQLKISGKAVEYHITQALKRLRVRLAHFILSITIVIPAIFQ